MRTKTTKSPTGKLQIRTVDQLLLHNTDTAVKPIMGKEVEEFPETIGEEVS
jgi:hypothetical protein